MKKVLVVAPHPDDETLGCGGTLLKHRASGDEVHWLIVTGMALEAGFPAERIRARALEIEAVAARYGFASVTALGLPTTRLDALPMAELVTGLSQAFKVVLPEIVYLPFRGDVHTDHRAVFDAAAACTKWFRYPSVRQVLCYEALSETDFGLEPGACAFQPNVFVDVSDHLEEKLAIMRLFEGETGQFPFPRSEEALRALAMVRGAACGARAAEGFMLLREIR